jgi:outer membrane autotransporter protein
VTATKASDGNYESVTSAPLDVVVGVSLAANEAVKVGQQNLVNNAQYTLGFYPYVDRLDTRNGSGRTTTFLPQGTSTNGMIAFSASAGQIVQAAGKGDMQVMPTSAQRPDQVYDPYLKTPGSVDIWIDGRFIWRNGADSAGGLDQRTFLGETGVDYLVTENLLIGLSVRLDTNDAKLGGAGGDLDTLGWLAGPYVVWEITPGLQADAKLAYGQSSNDISVIISGSRFDGSYDSTRWMAEGGLRGRLELSSILIEPGLRAAYYRETAESYTLSGGGGVVKEQELSLMRLSFDPRLTYRHVTEEGTSISPFLSPQVAAEWKETKSGDEGWDVYGAVEGGLSIATGDFSLSTNLSASGLGGEGAVSYSAGANLTIPLN